MDSESVLEETSKEVECRVSVSDFESVLPVPDSDTSILSEYDDMDKEILGASLLDMSLMNDDTNAANQPFVPFTLEEMSLVKTLRHWSNHNVRVIGELSSRTEDCDIHYLQSIGEEGGPFSILVQTKLVENIPPLNTPVQVFGQIQLINGSCPIILAKFFKNLISVDISYLNLALNELKKFVPHFIGMRKLNKCSVSNEDLQNM